MVRDYFSDLEGVVGEQPVDEFHGSGDVGGAVDVGVYELGTVVWPPVARVQPRSLPVPVETAPVDDEPMPGQFHSAALFELMHPLQLPLLRRSVRPRALLIIARSLRSGARTLAAARYVTARITVGHLAAGCDVSRGEV